MTIRYLSVCSGIEAASVAWEPLGWTPVAFAEIDAFPSAVLKHRFPHVPNVGDMTRLPELVLNREIEDPDVLVGGTPCQGFSVAGLRKSLSDDRSNLALQFIRIANAIDDIRRSDGREPAYILWENVPGVLSTDDNAFGTFLAGLVGSDAPLVPPKGTGWTDAGVVAGPQRCAAWRCLDAQHFGLAQRRKRVFVLAREHPRGWTCADALLPIIESVRWHSPPRRETGQGIAHDVAPCIGASGRGFERAGETRGQDPVVAVSTGDVSHCLNAGGMGRIDYETETLIAHSLRADGFDASEDGTGRGTPIVPIDLRQASRGEKITNNRATGSGGPPRHGVGDVGDPAFTVSERGQAVAFAENSRAELRLEGGDGSVTGSLKTGGGKPGQSYPVAQVGMQVRRLTPREAERLQGLPDDFTLVPYRGKPAADGPRYKALGNSFAVPVVRWIGERISLVEAELMKATMSEAAE